MTETIHVYLLDEGTDVWRPTQGRLVGPKTFEVLATPDYDPKAEKWQFKPGTIVECEERVLSGDRVLVAVRRAGPGSRGPVSPPQQ